MTYDEYITIQETKLDKEEFLYKINQLSDDQVDKVNQVLAGRDALTCVYTSDDDTAAYEFITNYPND